MLLNHFHMRSHITRTFLPPPNLELVMCSRFFLSSPNFSFMSCTFHSSTQAIVFAYSNVDRFPVSNSQFPVPCGFALCAVVIDDAASGSRLDCLGCMEIDSTGSKANWLYSD